LFELDIAALQHWLRQFMWPMIRVSGFCMMAPILGTALVPPRVRLLLALLIVMMLAPHLENVPQLDFLSPAAVVVAVQQLLIGVGLALFLQMLIQAFVVFGQIVAMQMGLGFASLNDPVNGITVTSVAQFYLMMVTLLFLGINGHLVMIDVLAESFRTLPITANIGSARLESFTGAASWMFAAALLMALPAVTALLVINCTLGVITRAAPQLNIFAIGFPLMLVLGMLILWASMADVLPNFERYSDEILQMMRVWIA
jgi:flagellar biosynthesis protein FliR